MLEYSSQKQLKAQMAPSNKSNQLVLKEIEKNRNINSSFRNFELSILIIDAFEIDWTWLYIH